MARRDKILQAAEKLLEHYGVGKTTMQDIAREASVGVGSVYLEFDSKDSIVEALAGRRHDEILAELAEAARSGRTFEDRLKAFLDARFHAFVRLGSSGAHAFELVHCSCVGVESAWKHFKDREREILCELIQAGVEAGDLDVPDAQVACDAIFRIYATFSPPFLYHDEDRRLRLMQEVHHIVLRGLVRR